MAEERIWRFLAFDFGAESGRAIVGSLAAGRLQLEELHRFPTQGIVMLGRRQWDVTRIYGEMLTALSRYVRIHGPHLDGIAVDTWGVDFGLIAGDGTLLSNPTHYRDKHHEQAMETALRTVSPEEVYASTGIQFLPFNTAWQLYSMVHSGSPLLEVADSLLMMADLFAYMLSGFRVCEYTNATTTQLVNADARTWDSGLIEKLGLPRHTFPDLVEPGTLVGPVLPEVAALTGLAPEVQVIAPATHDTGSAVAAVPVEGEGDDWAYLSSGTWSLLGVELRAPRISEKIRRLNFTNEGGVDGTIRFLKNIIGLWLVQECRRSWQRDGSEVDYGELMREAEAAEPFVTLIDVDDLRLLAPEDMPEMIRTLARESGQPEPATHGAMARCIFESLALKYRRTLREMDDVLGRRTARLHVIGGGVQNTLLCQMTASACAIPVIAGPVEATAIGNVLVQAMAVGALDSLADARRAAARSFELKRYEPVNPGSWDEIALRFAPAPV